MGWGTYVDDRVERLEYRLRRLPGGDRTHTEYILAWAALRDARILARLPKISADIHPGNLTESDLPHEAILKPKKPWWERNWWASNWWTGSRAAKAYAALHRADAAYLTLAPNAIVRQLAADLLSQLATCGLSITDPRYAGYELTLKNVANGIPTAPDEKDPEAEASRGGSAIGTKVATGADPVVPPAAPPKAPPRPLGDPAESSSAPSPKASSSSAPAVAPLEPPVHVHLATRQTLNEIGEAISQSLASQHYRVLTYRNLLLMTATGLSLVYLVLSLVGWRDPNFFSLCASSASLKPPCPSGNAPGSGDIFLLGFAGLVGGSVGALILLLSVSVAGAPFTIAVAQAILKLPAGAVISLVALFVLQHGALGILMPQSGSALVAWALLFGVGQQAVTQTIDKRAAAIMAGGSSTPPAPTTSSPGTKPPTRR